MSDTDSPAPVEPDSNPGQGAEEPTTAPQPPETTPGETEQPVPTGPAPETDSPALPDHGIDPDKGIDPDAGDEPTDPNKTTADELETENDQAPDLKSMSRAERAAYFKDLASSTRKDVEARLNQTYQAQPVDELTQKYTDQGYSEFEAKMLAREEARDQENDISRARAERAELNANLATQAMEVMNNVSWLNPNNKDAYDQTSSNAAIQLYDQLCLTRDDNTADHDQQGNPVPGTGQIIDASMTPKQFYGLIDTIRGSGSEAARIAAQKEAEQQMAAVAPPSSNSNKREADFSELSPAEQRKQLLAKGYLVT